MALSDYWIRYHVERGDIVIDPPPEDTAYQPCSLELRILEDLTIEPGQFLLSSTLEHVEIPWAPAPLMAKVEGKSSLGRLGLLVHATAGHIDPGFQGTITLELTNLSRTPIVLAQRQRICQLVFTPVTGPVLRPYGHPALGSHYQGQAGTTPSYLDSVPLASRTSPHGSRP